LLINFVDFMIFIKLNNFEINLKLLQRGLLNGI